MDLYVEKSKNPIIDKPFLFFKYTDDCGDSRIYSIIRWNIENYQIKRIMCDVDGSYNKNHIHIKEHIIDLRSYTNLFDMADKKLVAKIDILMQEIDKGKIESDEYEKKISSSITKGLIVNKTINNKIEEGLINIEHYRVNNVHDIIDLEKYKGNMIRYHQKGSRYEDYKKIKPYEGTSTRITMNPDEKLEFLTESIVIPEDKEFVTGFQENNVIDLDQWKQANHNKNSQSYGIE